MNIMVAEKTEAISSLLKTLGHPTRIQILQEIGTGEACVCHLEAMLGFRQAYLSQQLMALRMEGVLETHKEGRYVFYKLTNPRILELLSTAAGLKGINITDHFSPEVVCSCPKCSE